MGCNDALAGLARYFEAEARAHAPVRDALNGWTTEVSLSSVSDQLLRQYKGVPEFEDLMIHLADRTVRGTRRSAMRDVLRTLRRERSETQLAMAGAK